MDVCYSPGDGVLTTCSTLSLPLSVIAKPRTPQNIGVSLVPTIFPIYICNLEIRML